MRDAHAFTPKLHARALQSQIDAYPSTKIMDLAQLTLLTILATVTILSDRVLGAASWSSKEDRYNNYDLQRGPVFYEAYYADDQWPTVTDPHHQLSSENRGTKSRYMNRDGVLENIYQTPEDSFYSGPSDRDLRQREEPKVFSVPRNYNVATQLNKFQLRTVDTTDHVPGNEERLVEEKLELTNSQIDNESPYGKNKFSVRRFDDFMNLILSAIKSSALEILEQKLATRVSEREDRTESIMRISRNPRFVESDDTVDQRYVGMKDYSENVFVRPAKQSGLESQIGTTEDSTKNLLDRGASIDRYEVENFNSRMSFPPVENIFQPRSQIINYVFSPTGTPPKTENEKKEITISRSARSNELTKNYRDDLVDGMSKNSKRTDPTGPEVASIEVSELPRHKIRHHHGEKSRSRDHHRRQIAPGH